MVSFVLKPKQPFRLDLTVWALRRLPINEIDQWDGRTYTRIVVLNQDAARLTVTQQGETRILVDVDSERKVSRQELKAQATDIVEKLLGTRRDLHDFYTLAGNDRLIGAMMREFRGVKPPRFPTVFEALINAIACQQLSLHVGITLLNRLSHAYGKAWTAQNNPIHAFPLPDDLSHATPAKLRNLGFSAKKAQSIIFLARSVQEKRTDLDRLDRLTSDDALRHLVGLTGIGRWSAEYALLRGLGRLNIFPGDDVGAQANLQKLLDLRHRPDYEEVQAITHRWQPFAGLVYFHFLLNRLRAGGFIPPLLKEGQRPAIP